MINGTFKGEGSAWTMHFEKQIKEAADRATFRNLFGAISRIRKDAAKSIRRRKDPDIASPPGTPVFTHVGFAKQALWWDVTDESAIMGFRHSLFGTKGETHEFGKTEEGRDYPERPTVGPALERNIERFQKDWRSSIY